MDYLTKLMDFEGEKRFKKDIHSQEINIEIYLEKFIKWLGFFSVLLAVIAQLINEVSGTDMKCFPDRKAGFDKSKDWMGDQMHLSKAFGEYADTYCATMMVDYGPLETTTASALYSRADVDALASGKLQLPYRRCLEDQLDVEQCRCLAANYDGAKPPKICKKTPGAPKFNGTSILADNKYKETMYHHYFSWFLLVQAIFLLLPQLMWNSVFSDRILDIMLKIHDCAENFETESGEGHRKQLIGKMKILRFPTMAIVFFLKQLYYVIGGVECSIILSQYVGYGIQENQVTRCLIEEYAFMICASPANGALWFVFLINSVVMVAVIFSGSVNILARIVARATQAHVKREFLLELLNKMFADSKDLKKKVQDLTTGCNDYPFFSRLCQENRHIFGDLYVALKSRNELSTVIPDEEDLSFTRRLTMRQSAMTAPHMSQQ